VAHNSSLSDPERILVHVMTLFISRHLITHASESDIARTDRCLLAILVVVSATRMHHNLEQTQEETTKERKKKENKEQRK